MRLDRPARILKAVLFRLYRRVVAALPGGRIDAFGADAGGIGAIFVINLDRQPRRMARTMRELSRFDTRDGRRLTDLVIRIPAFDARDGRVTAATADVDPRYIVGHQLYVQPDARLEDCFGPSEPVTMTRQEIAVARSHIEAWKAIAAGSDEQVLILEDDVWFLRGAAQTIDRAWREALLRKGTAGPAMLYLSYEDAGGTCERADAHGTLFRPVRGLWFLSGYVLSQESAQNLLRAMPVVGPVDMWINRQFDRLMPLAVQSAVILQRPDVGSDNSYSMLPFLTRAGIVDANSLPAPARSGRVRIVAWTQRGEREPLAMALSMLGLRVLAFDTGEPPVGYAELSNLFTTFDALIDPPFEPDDLPNGIDELVTGFVLEPVRADQVSTSHRSKQPWIVLTGDGPSDEWWSPLCSLVGVETPIHAFPAGAPSNWRVFRDGRRPILSHSHDWTEPRMAMDDTPWAIEKVDGWPTAVASLAPLCISRVVKMRCSLTEPAIEMTAMRGTFPGNLATFSHDAINYSAGGATITLVESDAEDRPYRSGAFSSASRFRHGRFEIEMMAARGGGLVTGFFLHRSEPRQEIDVEITGNEPCRMLLNVYFNPGCEGTDLDYGYRGSPCSIDLGFDASADFHRYAIEWLPDRIRWFVDDILVHERGSWDPTPVPHLPMTLHANLWSPRSVELAGAAELGTSSATALFRSIKVNEAI